MAKSLKETLLGTLVHGEEILENIRVMRSCLLYTSDAADEL